MTATQQRDTEDPRANLVENPTGTKGRFWRPHASFFVVSGMFLCPIFVLQYYPHSEWTWLVVVGLWYLTVRPYQLGRGYQQAGKFFVGMWKTIWQRGDRWSNPVAEDLHKLEHPERYTEKAVEQAKRRKKFPRRYSRYPSEIEVHRLGDIALLYSPQANIDSLVVVADGSPQAAMSYAEQYHTISTYERVAKEVSLGQNEFAVRCTLLFRRRPINRFEVVRMWLAHMHPLALLLADATDEDRAAMSDEEARLSLAGANLKQRLELSDEHDSDVTMATVWTITRSHKLSHGSLGEDELNHEPIAELMADVLAGLERCRVVNPRVLGLGELRRFIHAGLNVTNADTLHAWADQYPEALDELSSETSDRLSDQGLSGEALAEQLAVQTSPHWPGLHVKEAFSHCVIDGTYHTVLRMRSNDKFTLPDASWALDAASPRWYSRAVIGETTTGSGELRFMNRTMPIMQEARNEIGVSQDTPEARAKKQDDEDRRTALYEHKFKTDFNILVCVSASSKRELRREVQRAKRLAKSLGLSPHVIHGRAYQFDGVMAATWGIPVL